MTRAAIVLAGGRATRLGGVDKPALTVRGRSMLATAVDAVAGSDRIVVVGPRRPLDRDVVWTVEDQPGTGPVAALAAGIAALADLDADTAVVLLAADLPMITAATVGRLLAVGTAAVLVDADGRDQWLLSVWRLGDLRDALPVEAAGAALRRTLAGLDPVRVPAEGAEAADVDTPEDLRRVSSQDSHR